ncbi:NYN domain-containing protein [Microbispora sp. H10670]|uniref:NYN domain-containing protein n=1 Tax=Microbispora sp. H10670 TaxID=2729108 RepID=UPI0016031230|nr:NYN domain-containing protein [Microbispora sp. H10670]
MTARRVRIFIDFWNFQLSWNSAMNPEKCDWRALPPAVVQAVASVLASVNLTDPLDLEETLLYASVDPVADAPLRKWLTGTIERLPSWSVSVRERRSQPRQVHCRNCGTMTTACPSCGQSYMAKPEKGVDAAIVTDMLSLAWQDAYDVAVPVTSDADFVPAVERVQERGLKVINAGWSGKGHQLKAACWGSFDLDFIAADICR